MPPAARATTPAKPKSSPVPSTAPPAAARSKVLTTAAPVPAGPAITLKVSKPAQDPRFKRAMEKLSRSAVKARSHPPAGQKAAEAQAAALPPPNEKLTGAQAHKVDTMGAAQTGKPESTSFLAMLRAEIQKVMPKKTEDAADFMKGEDRQQLKGAMTGNVTQQKEEATTGMKAASEAPPDTGKIQGKEVTSLPSEGAPAPPPAVGANEAMPEPRPEADVSLAQGKKDSDKLLTDAEVTTSQMEKANDPRFTAVVTTKTKADRFADAGPKQYRAQEQGVLMDAGAKALNDEKKGLSAFTSEAGQAQQNVRSRQLTAKEKDELARKKVTDHIQGVFDKTKAAVDKKLFDLDGEVEAMFDRGADVAVEKMKKYVEKRFDDRYSGLSGTALWLKDKLWPLPAAVKAWFAEAHKVFLAELDAVVVRVANLVERRLKEAKDEIAKGQKEIRNYVEGLPANLKAVGLAAEKEMQSRFDELRQGVDAKKDDLAQKLAQRYKDAYDKGEKALKELKDAHKSLYERVRDAIAEVVKVLREFKNKIMGMLKKGKNTIDLIVADPIGFLKNLLKALGKGLSQFVNNIWTHLKEGFMAFLFGSLTEAGVTPPKDLSLPSLLLLVLQVLGLTYERIRAKAVKLLGERAVSLIETVAEAIKELVTGGVARLWEMMKEYLGNLKEMIVDAIQDWLITTIIKAAVTKLVSMFNPVGAIIQAIITIYNVVMFFIERIRQILAFVESVINSAFEIATGAIDAAANWIEKALARTVPIIIAFLARLLGISGITEKIVGVIKKIQTKVDLAIDKVLGKIVGGIGKLFGKGKALVAKGAEKIKELMFPKKKFKVGKDAHTIEAVQAGEEYKIIVKSETFGVEEFIAYAKKQGQGIQGINDQTSKLQEENNKWKSMKTEDDKQNKLKEKQYTKISQLIENIMIKLPPKEPMPPSVIHWDSLDQGRAKGVTANPLTVTGDGGSPPIDDILGCDTKFEYKGRKVAYIRAHLLHHGLHGPGRKYNMTPTSSSINQLMYNRVEKPALEALGLRPENKAKQKKTKLKYITKVTYDPNPPEPKDKLRNVAKHIKMEATATELDAGVEKVIGRWPLDEDNYP